MATIACVIDATYQENTIKATWEGLVSGSVTGAPIPSNWLDYSDRSIQVVGTFGGATVTIQGSNDEGVTYGTINDDTGTALTFATTSGLIKQATTICAGVRPSVTSDTGTTDLDVIAICHRPRSGQEG